MNERELFKRAKAKVKKKKDFYSHFGIYCASVLFFLSINLLTSPDILWFIFPTLGWGLGLAGHYFSVFGLPELWAGEDWEEKELLKEMKKMKKGSDRLYLEPDEDASEEELELLELEAIKKKWGDDDLV